jgi:hypothetical protein
MRATRSSKRSLNSNRLEYVAVALALLVIGVAAAWGFHEAGFVLYYGDAESHLNIARRIVDSRTPGYEQIGTAWLPLLHVLTLPLASDMQWWQSGWAGTIPSVACFVLGGVLLYATARVVYSLRAAAMCAVLVYALNPNLLYLQSTPMTEPLFYAMQLGVLFSTIVFARTQSLWAAAATGVFSAAAALTRYDGWFLLPFTGLYILIAARRNRLQAAVVFGVIAGLAPVYWLAHNAYFYSNPLDFYNGPYSAKAIQGDADYPGKHDWPEAIQYYSAAAWLCIGTSLAALSVAGTAAALLKRAFWPLFFLALPPVFYLVSMYSSGNPIFVPHLETKSYYNTRYGLSILPLAAFAAGALAFRPVATIVVVCLATAPWLIHVGPESWITWKESEVNSIARRAWTAQAAGYLRDRYRPGAGIAVSFGDQIGVLREAGIPLKESLHEGNGPAALGAFHRPDLFLWEEWVIAIAGDPMSQAMATLARTGSPYVRVKLIEVKDASPLEIYRRIRPMPKP